MHFKLFTFYLITSFLFAVVGYIVLENTLPNGIVFGSFIRMFSYHDKHPIAFITIPCFFYGIVSAIFHKQFQERVKLKRLLVSLKIGIITIGISLPLGGMLYLYYDMVEGYFPQNWFEKIISNGTSMGFSFGWLVIVSSFPYNILGLICNYHILILGGKAIKIRHDLYQHNGDLQSGI